MMNRSSLDQTRFFGRECWTAGVLRLYSGQNSLYNPTTGRPSSNVGRAREGGRDMGFRFNIDKTMQAIAALLHFHGTKEMSYLRMLKLLYIADRESLKETGRPITGDRIVAMEHGPVLSGVYNLVKGEHTAWPIWSEFFKKNG